MGINMTSRRSFLVWVGVVGALQLIGAPCAGDGPLDCVSLDTPCLHLREPKAGNVPLAACHMQKDDVK